jgi:hypothetical protein
MNRETVAGGILFTILVILCVLAGCIAPPAENGLEDPVSPAPMTRSYVNEVPLYSSQTAIPYDTYASRTSPTKIYEEYVCRVYQKEKVIYYNKSAIAFNLISPPMYFNYSVIPQKNAQGIYPPPAYTITFRDKKTGATLKQFGLRSDQSDPYYSPAGLSDTVKVRQSGDYIMEFEGANVKINVEIWVKPDNDIGDRSKLTCINWPGSLWYEL